jgi:hypothetical protein
MCSHKHYHLSSWFRLDRFLSFKGYNKMASNCISVHFILIVLASIVSSIPIVKNTINRLVNGEYKISSVFDGKVRKYISFIFIFYDLIGQ